MRTLVGAGLLCVMFLLAGCSGVEGVAQPQGLAAADPDFDPCEDIPDDAVRAIGLDPGTESQDIVGVRQPGWSICGWRSATHSVSVLAANFTMDDVRHNADFGEFVEIVVGDRSALEYRIVGERDRRSCDIALQSGLGTVLVTAADEQSGPIVSDPCPTVRTITEGLLVHIPGDENNLRGYS